MSIDKDFLDKFINVTECAAYGASPFIGKNDKNAADQGAVNKMRSTLNSIKFNGKIVIGEGEMDEAPMLYIGEKVGTGVGPELDIAVDPLRELSLPLKDFQMPFLFWRYQKKVIYFQHQIPTWTKL